MLSSVTLQNLKGKTLFQNRLFFLLLCAKRNNMLPSTLLSLAVKVLAIFCPSYVHIELVSGMVIMYS